MSGLRGDDDGGRKPPDPDGLPGFPAEWGRIVIPDDASELDREAAKVRRELRRETPAGLYRLHPRRRLQHLTLPLVLVTMAVLIATTSLFAAMWPQSHRSNGSRSTHPATAAPKALHTGAALPNLTLTNAAGHPLRLRDTHPAIVLLTRHCRCARLITGAVRATRTAAVTVLVVGDTHQPTLPSLPAKAHVATAVDPSGKLAGAIAAGASPAPTGRTGAALLVNAKGDLVRMVPATTSAADFSKQVPALAK